MSTKQVMSAKVELQNGVVYVPFEPDTVDGQRFVVDIYSAESGVHPEFHLGWWAWPSEIALEATAIQLVYHSADDVQAYLLVNDEKVAPYEYWFNPDYRLAPLQDFSLLWYNAQDEPRRQAQMFMAVHDERLLEAYYADNARRYGVIKPFHRAFHQRRLDVLNRLFRRYIQSGSQVLDVGSGASMFYLINEGRWPFQITCLDLDRTLLQNIAGERPDYHWMVATGQHLPFLSTSVDALYAGEVIEHVADPDATLTEWGRVLRPGGILIVTTPNRLRLLNRVNRDTVPVSIEHLIEFTCEELDDMFKRNGFRVLHREGIYLELLALWRQRFPHIDPLAAEEPMPRHLLALKPLLALAGPLPQFAFNLVFVGQKL